LREHAAIAPRHLGLRVVIAKSFARIHWQNLANFGVLALEFGDADDYESINQDDTLRIADVRDTLAARTLCRSTTSARTRLSLCDFVFRRGQSEIYWPAD
jgi:aconitase A